MASGRVWNLWVWLAGGGCGWNLCVVVRKDIYYLILLIPTSLVPALFAAASLLFVH